jgi:hypothetical protein
MKKLIAPLITGLDKQELVLTATLIFLMLHASIYRYVQMPITLLCMVALLFPLLRSSKWIWGAIIFVYILGCMPHYFELINHKFLYLYWCVAVFASLFAANFEQAICFNARLLLVLVFAIATLQKLFSADYMDGSFMLYILAKDERIGGLLVMLGWLPKNMLQQNMAAVAHVMQYTPQPEQVPLLYTQSVKLMARVLTWLTLFVEAVTAILFALPATVRLARYRDMLFLLFLFFTYLLAPVAGFGSILAIMGMAQADTRAKMLLYVLMFLLMQVYALQVHQLAAFLSELF